MRRNKEFTIGISVATLFVVLVWLVFMFGKQSFPTLGEEYKLIAQFSTIPGVEKNATVNMNGIRIGRVNSVRLVDAGNGTRYAEVELLIRKEYKVYTSDECRISSPLLSLGGNISLEIARRRDLQGPLGVELKDGEPIPGAIQSDLFQSFGNLEGELTSVLQNVADTAKKFETFIDSINAVIGTPQEAWEKQKRFQEIIDKAGEMMVELNHLAINVNALLGDEEIHDNIRSVARQLPDTLLHVRDSLDNFNTFSKESRITLNHVSKTFDKAEKNLDHLESFTEVLGEEGPAILQSFSRASRRLEGALNDISALMAALRNPDGSLGQLLNNPEMYNNIQQTISNVEEISETLKPIVSDFRVFSDKIARDPGVLGVRGAINPGSSLKGLPVNPIHRPAGITHASYNRFPGGMPQSSYLSLASVDPELEMIQRQNLVQRALYNASQRQQAPIQYGHSVPFYSQGSQSGLGNLLPKLSFTQQPDYTEYYEYGSENGCGVACGAECGIGGCAHSGMSMIYDSDFQSSVIQPPVSGPVSSGPAPQVGSPPVTSPQPMVAPVPLLTSPQPTDQLLLPPTILEFGPMEDDTDPLEAGMNMTIYPAKDRGYILEFETALPQPAQSEAQFALTEANSEKTGEEMDHSAYAPQVIPNVPAIQSQVMTQQQPQQPAPEPQPQYGSVRRGIAR